MTPARILMLLLLICLPACTENESVVKVDLSKVETMSPPAGAQRNNASCPASAPVTASRIG